MGPEALTVALAEVLERIEAGRRPKGGVLETATGIPSLGGENVTQDGHLQLSQVKRVPRAFFDSMPKGHLCPWDVLINKDGAQTGKVAIYQSEFSAASINEHLFLLRGKRESIEQKYLFWSLFHEGAQRQIAKFITGSAQPGLGRGFVRFVRLRLPPLAEQLQISEVLDTADEAIRKTERVIAKLQQVRQGLLYDLLTRGIDEQGELRDPQRHPEEFKRSVVGVIPATWEAMTLEEVTEAPICYGIVQAGPFFPGGPQVLTIRDVLGDYRTGLHRTKPNIDAQYARSRVVGDDVLLSIKGTIGRVGVVPDHFKGNISRDLGRLRLRTRLIPSFTKHYLSSPMGQRRLELAVVGTTRAEISIHVLKRFRVPVPSVPEQIRIAATLDAAERRGEDELHYAAKLRALKRGLTDDLLTGRVRLPMGNEAVA
jgi:type I restriction enzyme, S subunit